MTRQELRDEMDAGYVPGPYEVDGWHEFKEGHWADPSGCQKCGRSLLDHSLKSMENQSGR